MSGKSMGCIPDIPLRVKNDNLERTWCFERQNNRCVPHFHLCVEIAYVEKGEMEALISGKKITIREGQMVVISSHVIHSFSTPHSSLVIVAVFPMNFVPDIHRRLQNKVFACSLIEHPPKELITLLQMLLKYTDTSRETVQGLSQTILSILIDRYGLIETFPDTYSGTMHQIIIYMQEHFSEDIRLEALAERFNYSASRLSHLFTSQLHYTFTEFLNVLRCRNAAVLLRGGVDNVLDAAERSGFHSLSTFYRVFKKLYNASPSEYAQTKTDT